VSEQRGKALAGRLGISGVMVFRDKDGNILKEVNVSGSLPLAPETVSTLTEPTEADNGLDNHE
jgi:hypothetical protein